MESDDVKFAKCWAGMQEPPLTVAFNEKYEWWILSGETSLTDFVFDRYMTTHSTEAGLWKELAEVLAPIRRSLEPAILRMRGGK